MRPAETMPEMGRRRIKGNERGGEFGYDIL
jgi:hypothetical protein